MAFNAIDTSSVVIGGNTISNQNTYSGDVRVSINESVATAVTDQLIIMAVDFSTIQYIYIVASVAMTFETNSTSAPTDTWILVAGEPWVWHINSLVTNKLTADITLGVITNGSGSTGTFQWESLHNTAP